MSATGLRSDDYDASAVAVSLTLGISLASAFLSIAAHVTRFHCPVVQRARIRPAFKRGT
jgi:hypothetical protein